jgi:hypothetical protein
MKEIQVWSISWYNSDSEELKYLSKNLSQCHFVHHKYHMDWLGIEPGRLPDGLSHDTAFIQSAASLEEVS